MIKLIGLSGYIGSGKDQVGNTICFLDLLSGLKSEEMIKATLKQGPGLQYDYFYSKWHKKKFATPLRQVAEVLTGIPVKLWEDREFKDRGKLNRDWEEEQARAFMKRIGEVVRRFLHKNGWVNALFKDYTPDQYWVITDVRFPNEAQHIKDLGGIVIRINKEGVERVDDPTETSLDNWPFDFWLNNNGTMDELTSEVKKMLVHFNILD